jgi:endonuclease/exonuclease/phosphatase family metal-dependent hydrolase
MAGRFSKSEWDKIEAELLKKPDDYGLPDGGREESVVLGSFNIRKLSRFTSRERELKFMARFCARCDLIAIQKVQDNLDGLRYLKQCVDERVSGGGEYDLVVSDVTGKTPGERGMGERLAFLYRKNRIRRLDMTSDMTFDRTAVFNRYRKNQAEMDKAWAEFDKKMQQFNENKRKSKPTFVAPTFVTFTRTPHLSAFEIPAAGTAKPLGFIAVNAHLIYGAMVERKAEFEELARWMVNRLSSEARMVAPNFILLGDLNLDLDNSEKDREKIEDFMAELKKTVLDDKDSRRVYFPFIGKHPVTNKVIRTNARSNQTFDQIGFFTGQKEKRLPQLGWAKKIRKDRPDEFDYGVFNFADLFSRAIEGKTYKDISNSKRNNLGKKFENSVSDHMPIWVRIPRPGF